MTRRQIAWISGMTAIVFGISLAVERSIAAEVSLAATHLRCEYLVDPLGIDVEKPRLSWVLAVGYSWPETDCISGACSPHVKRRWPTEKATCGTAAKCNPLRRSRSNTPANRCHRGYRATGKSKSGIRMANHPSGVSRRAGPWDCCGPRTGRRSGSLTRRPPNANRAHRIMATIANSVLRPSRRNGLQLIWASCSRSTRYDCILLDHLTGPKTCPDSCFRTVQGRSR